MSDLLATLFDRCLPEPNSGCWLWERGLNSAGYGMHAQRRVMRLAHKLAYEAINGAVPQGLELDHLCRVRCCINPDHLEAVSRRTNTLRGETRPAENVLKDRCPKGHPYAGGNLYTRANGHRVCRACAAERAREKRRAMRHRTV